MYNNINYDELEERLQMIEERMKELITEKTTLTLNQKKYNIDIWNRMYKENGKEYTILNNERLRIKNILKNIKRP